MNYTEFYCRMNLFDPWREILIAQLADIGFESFEETFDGLKAYVRTDLFDETMLADALLLPECDDENLISWEVNNIEAINWNEEWERNFEPVLIADKVYIRAPFHPENPGVQHDIVIEPKMSFGTGHHETTRLVTEWLLETEMTGKSVLDMGCGTGILAIVAEKRGAAHIVAIDNYLFAYENTIDNLVRNDCGNVVARHGDAGLLGDETFNIIIANINRNVLIDDMGKYRLVLRPHGLIFLSGFLEQDKSLIIEHAGKLGLSVAGEKILDGWVGLKLSLN